MTVRALIQKLLMATTERDIKENGGDPLDAEVVINDYYLRDYTQVRLYNGSPVIALFVDVGEFEKTKREQLREDVDHLLDLIHNIYEKQDEFFEDWLELGIPYGATVEQIMAKGKQAIDQWTTYAKTLLRLRDRKRG